MNLEIVPTLKTYLIELGFAVSLDRIKEKCHEAIVRERIEIYINQQTKYNIYSNFESVSRIHLSRG